MQLTFETEHIIRTPIEKKHAQEVVFSKKTRKVAITISV